MAWGGGRGGQRSKMKKHKEAARNEATHVEIAGGNAQGKAWKDKR